MILTCCKTACAVCILKADTASAAQAFADSVEPATREVTDQVRTIGKDVSANAEPQAEIIAEQVG